MHAALYYAIFTGGGPKHLPAGYPIGPIRYRDARAHNECQLLSNGNVKTQLFKGVGVNYSRCGVGPTTDLVLFVFVHFI